VKDCQVYQRQIGVGSFQKQNFYVCKSYTNQKRLKVSKLVAYPEGEINQPIGMTVDSNRILLSAEKRDGGRKDRQKDKRLRTKTEELHIYTKQPHYETGGKECTLRCQHA
jgi:hypothetical protein